ncbi:MAG TPA: S41 family peptidase [Christiangramia sp.]|nr:S41 family peptidase [Christiangramia sp.]
MKIYKYLVPFILLGGIITSCDKDDLDDKIKDNQTEVPGEEPEDDLSLEIRDFEWKALNTWYLFKDQKDVLADNYFADQEELNTFLMDWDSPEDLFYEGLLFEYPSTDRFSWIVDDYEELENDFAGISETDGINFGVSRACDGCNELVAYVRYVVNGSPADEAGIERGMIYSEINGQQLTVNNYVDLLYYNPNLTITYGFNDLSGGNVGDVNREIEVTKTTVEENPVHVVTTFDREGMKVGYIMYNSFNHEFDAELNDAFAYLKGEGVTELVLDLRYNRGGRGTSAVDLGSMINLGLEGKIFMKQKYNSLITNAYNSQFGAEALIDRFDDQIYEYDNDHPEHSAAPINSLNLEKVYIIATGGSYSASEVLINGLKPHMDVVHIGSTTGGKFQGSVTLYDSSNFFKDGSNLNPDHKYAMQPLISSNTNANGEAYPDGLIPDVEKFESVLNYGKLGDQNEPLLNVALQLIDGTYNRSMIDDKGKYFKTFSETGAKSPTYQRFYLDGMIPELPNLRKRLDLDKK